MEETYGFDIDSSSITELVSSNKTSYTMLIHREELDDSFFENLVVEIDSLNQIDANIIKYTYDTSLATEYNEAHNAFGLNAFVEITPIIYDASTTKVTCSYMFIATCYYQGVHIAGPGCTEVSGGFWASFCSGGDSGAGGYPDNNYNDTNNQTGNNGYIQVGNGTTNGGDPVDNPDVYTAPVEPPTIAEQISVFITLNDFQQVWLNKPNNEDVAEDIRNYLLNDGDLAFAEEAINANINSPFKVDLFDVYDKINYLPNDSTSIAAKKFNCVYKKLTENPKFKTLFTDVFGENQDIDITIKFNENPAWTDSQLAVTEWDGVSNNTHMIMAFNKNVINQNHPLVIASTIVHEAIHAYFNLKIKECDESITIDEINTQEFDDLLNNYNYTCGFTDQHTLMYQHMIPVIKDIVNDLFPELVASEDMNSIQNFYLPPNGELHTFTWENALHFMSLNGFQGATSFNPTSNIVINPQDANYLLQQYYDRINSNAFNKSTCE